MNSDYTFFIRFSGLTVRFALPTKVNLPQNFSSLICEDVENPSAQYTVSLLTTPLCPETEPIAKDGDAYIYNYNKGYLCIFSALTADDGCQVACFLCPNGENILYYPQKMWDYYRQYWHCTHLLMGERMLMYNNALLLHSSVVIKDGKAVLFYGPSGAGKSTQADLWAKHLGADIINGDRCVITQKDGTFYGGGSIWSGTSGINRSESAPIAGIFLLKKSDENTVRRIRAEAFSSLFSQTTVNGWDSEHVGKVTDIYSELLMKVPVYELSCRADKDAVMLAYDTIF